MDNKKAAGYKVIALISGGKDSFLSILECQAQGHQIVALANLYPPSSSTQDEDLNSHMYQTAGHALIPFYEKATGFPLYRAEIKGTAVQLCKEYDGSHISNSTTYDETEDLTLLLKSILVKHPEANAVCSGAILSTYQRTRIEDVCLRLNLKPLAYLWQMSFLHPGVSEDASITEKSAALLEHFATVGLDARIVKVASGGLDESFLWQSLLDPRTRHKIKAAMKRFGGSVVGEGGEFETLVLSGPRSLFHGRIVVSEDAIKIKSGQGGEAWVDLDASQIHVEKRQDSDSTQVITPDDHSTVNHSTITSQTMLSQRILTNESDEGDVGAPVSKTSSSIVTSLQSSALPAERSHEKNDLFHFANYRSSSEVSSTCGDQTLHIMSRIRYELSGRNLAPTNMLFTTILLRSMDDFAEMNTAYSTFFESPLPPARVTIAVGPLLPQNVSVVISAVASTRDLVHKQGLHVQSMSHWAPANIGPYSQAISIPIGGLQDPRLVFIAGQIPLVPSTMQHTIYQGETEQEIFSKDAILALRHATRIGIEMNAIYFSHAVAFVCSDEHMSARERTNIAFEAWKSFHSLFKFETDEESSELDAWDLKYGGQGSLVNNEDTIARHLPDQTALQPESGTLSGFLAVEVDDLPRSSNIEWQVMGYADGQIDIKDNKTACKGGLSSISTRITTEHLSDDSLRELGLDDGDTGNDSTHTVYVTGSMGQSRDDLPPGVTVPCHSVWGVENTGDMLKKVDYGIVTQHFKWHFK